MIHCHNIHLIHFHHPGLINSSGTCDLVYIVSMFVLLIFINKYGKFNYLNISYQGLIVILRLHYVPGGHGGHVSDNREQNGITVRRRGGIGKRSTPG